jgi:uncharacterized protein YjbI with pentapeptide repeats
MPQQRGEIDRDVQPPRLPRHLLAEDAAGVRLIDGEVYGQSLISDCQLAGQAAAGVVFEQMHLRRVDFGRTRLARSRFVDVRFEACDLSSVDWEKSHFRRVELIGCRLLGARMPDSYFADTLIRDCSAELVFLTAAEFKAARFERTSLLEANFDAADLSGVVFVKCDLSGSNLRGANLAGADLRSSVIGGVQVGIAELQGAIVDSMQAAQIAALLGLVVKDAGEDRPD